MNRIGIVLLAAASAVAFGCTKDKPQPTTEAPAPAAPAASSVASAPSPAESASAPATGSAGKMNHCPSGVEGAKTAAKDVPGGVEVSITASDAPATAEIRNRATFLASSAKDTSPGVQHNGSGEGGGMYGRCTIVMRNTNVVASEIPGGAKIVVTAKDAKEQDWLRRETRTRIGELETPAAVGAGVQRMSHCPNAVTGAKTTVADVKDAVQLTVTGKDEAATKEIRERTAKLVEAAKKDPTSVQHDGSGSGGGVVGRCPVVLKDTLVEAKDAPGGSVITVKPKNAKDLTGLKKEVRDRTAKFD